jgi:type II secretory pathway predicted ATPase ExeA
MYESFYGFREKPFKLLPDPDYLFMNQGHENAYVHLEHAIIEKKVLSSSRERSVLAKPP